MKRILLILPALVAALMPSMGAMGAEAAPPVYQASTPAVAPDPDVSPAPPPSAPPKRSAAELEKLVAPIALYPDPLLAVMLPASVYPLEIVQAARFMKDTNNLALLEQQAWDDNVKAIAKFPAALQKMDADISWTAQLGEAFVAQQLELMNAIQALRGKAQSSGTLQNTPEQTIVVTNTVVERTLEQQVVYVTNTVVQIEPANPQVVYVPQYSPAVVYEPAPAVVDPLVPLVTFGVGMAVGAAIADHHCDWNYGGVYVGRGVVFWGGDGHRPPYYPPPPGFRPPRYYPPPGYRPPPPGYRPPGVPPPGYRPPPPPAPGAPTPATAQRWQPDPARVQSAGATGSPKSLQARGWQADARAAAPGFAPGSQRPGSAPAIGTQPAGTRPPPAPGGAGGAGVSRPSSAPNVSRPAPGAGQARPSPSTARPTRSSSSQGSAFSDVGSGSATRNFSSRGSASRSGGGGSRGGRR